MFQGAKPFQSQPLGLLDPAAIFKSQQLQYRKEVLEPPVVFDYNDSKLEPHHLQTTTNYKVRHVTPDVFDLAVVLLVYVLLEMLHKQVVLQVVVLLPCKIGDSLFLISSRSGQRRTSSSNNSGSSRQRVQQPGQRAQQQQQQINQCLGQQ